MSKELDEILSTEAPDTGGEPTFGEVRKAAGIGEPQLAAVDGKFVYEGTVALGQQEGGFAAPAVELADLNIKRTPLLGNPYGSALLLSEVLREDFGTEDQPHGDEKVKGRIRITVERVDG